MKSLTLFSAILFLAATNAIAAGPASHDPKTVQAGAYAVEPNHTRVQFSVSHMDFTHWYGDFTHASGTLNIDPKNVSAAKVDITIPTGSVSTTNTKLDGELKSDVWFDAAKFPTIHFVSTKVVRTAPNKATITGDLTFHGVTRPVTLMASFNGAGVNAQDMNYTVGFDASTSFKRSDFGVKADLPLIGDETTLRISAAFEKAK
jgi:polyisoprenoid-binding protein YceI